jgi:hypothetical protein
LHDMVGHRAVRNVAGRIALAQLYYKLRPVWLRPFIMEIIDSAIPKPNSDENQMPIIWPLERSIERDINDV